MSKKKTKRVWTEKRLENFLLRLIEMVGPKRDMNAISYERACLLTRANGIVIRVGEQEFQVQIVDSSRRLT
jgi:D-ribose pyranose/furanose isomerase RbsD